MSLNLEQTKQPVAALRRNCSVSTGRQLAKGLSPVALAPCAHSGLRLRSHVPKVIRFAPDWASQSWESHQQMVSNHAGKDSNL